MDLKTVVVIAITVWIVLSFLLYLCVSDSVAAAKKAEERATIIWEYLNLWNPDGLKWIPKFHSLANFETGTTILEGQIEGIRLTSHADRVIIQAIMNYLEIEGKEIKLSQKIVMVKKKK